MQTTLSPPRDGGSLLQGSAQRKAHGVVCVGGVDRTLYPVLTRNVWSRPEGVKIHCGVFVCGVCHRSVTCTFLNAHTVPFVSSRAPLSGLPMAELELRCIVLCPFSQPRVRREGVAMYGRSICQSYRQGPLHCKSISSRWKFRPKKSWLLKCDRSDPASRVTYEICLYNVLPTFLIQTTIPLLLSVPKTR